jgi:hypothetical protein
MEVLHDFCARETFLQSVPVPSFAMVGEIQVFGQWPKEDSKKLNTADLPGGGGGGTMLKKTVI